MADRYDNCTEITPDCPLEGTIYGFYPKLGANAFFLAFFSICLVFQLVFGLRYKTWTYLIACGFGCLCSLIGYVGRILLHDNPWSDAGFNMQITCLIIAPAFFSAGIYLTLKYLVLTFGTQYSRLQPRWYTWIFICCDLFSLILQGAGGGTAATADTFDTQKIGNDLMMAGIVWQVFTLMVFGFLAGTYAYRSYKDRANHTATAKRIAGETKFRLYACGLVLAFFTIFIRCVYRIAEMANGWQNSIMRDETDFIVLEGVMIVIATLCLTAFHPGLCFKPMSSSYRKIAPNGIQDEKDLSGFESSPDSAVRV